MPPADDRERAAAVRPHVVVVVPRGEAVRNFLYSDTLPELAKAARVTVLSVVQDDAILAGTRPYAEILPLPEFPPPRPAAYLRTLIENAHDRWLWSAVAQNHWQLRDLRASERGWSARARRQLVKLSARLLAHEPVLAALTRWEQALHHRLRPTREFDALFAQLEPDLVFNGSHIHGLAGELPLRVAARLGIPTAGFIFSWDNLTSRSRIFVPYDHYLVWHENMKAQLLRIYPRLKPAQVAVTGTPQFDFHCDPRFAWSRAELCAAVGLDPARPYVLYTTGIANHFFAEHLHVAAVIQYLSELGLEPKPQLVVRTYVKGTSPEMLALAARAAGPDVIFPPVRWESRWQTPLPEDLRLYTNLLRHAALGINAASTVSLELLLFDHPVINLDFDPPEANLPACLGYRRHIRFDHYWPIAQSGAVMVARSSADLRSMLKRGLTDPAADRDQRRALLTQTFGAALDGHAGRRVATTLLTLAHAAKAPRQPR